MKGNLVVRLRRATIGTAVVAALMSPAAASAQATVVMPMIVSAAAWLGEKVAEHYAGIALDKADEAVAAKLKSQLTTADKDLRSKGSDSALDRTALKGVSDQLAILNQLLSKPVPTQASSEDLSARLQASLATMQSALSQRDQEVSQLKAVIGQLQAAVARPAEGQPATAPVAILETNFAGVKPSFDCARAKTFVEHEICGSADISGADAELGRVYQAARGRLAPEAAAQLRTEELAWLRRRDYLLNSVCMRRDGHIEAQCAVFFWRQRIAELQRV